MTPIRRTSYEGEKPSRLPFTNTLERRAQFGLLLRIFCLHTSGETRELLKHFMPVKYQWLSIKPPHPRTKKTIIILNMPNAWDVVVGIANNRDLGWWKCVDLRVIESLHFKMIYHLWPKISQEYLGQRALQLGFLKDAIIKHKSLNIGHMNKEFQVINYST